MNTVKVLIKAISVLSLSCALSAQTHTFPAEDTVNTFTNTNQFTVGAQFGPVTVSTLPSAPNGTVIYASDGLLGSNPCQGGSTGAMASMVEGAWSCGVNPSWSNLTAPTANLALAMAGYTSIFTTTSPLTQMFAWKNTTAATSGASQSSPTIAFCGQEWHSAASVEGCGSFQYTPNTGTDAGGTITLAHTGTGTGPVVFLTPTINAPGFYGTGTGAAIGTGTISNTDLGGFFSCPTSGNCTGTGGTGTATSFTYTFAGQYSYHPRCPQFGPEQSMGTNYMWATYNSAYPWTVTFHLTTAATGTTYYFDFACIYNL